MLKSRKTFIAAIVISALLILLVAGTQVVQVVEANPFIGLNNAEPIEGTIPPNITIFSPLNNTIYFSHNIRLSFNVSKPELPSAWQSGLGHIIYTLDNDPVEVYSLYTSNDNAPFLQGSTYTQNLTLPEGNHTLTVDAYGVVYPNNTSIFESDNSSTINFSIDSTPTPTPSAGIPSITIVTIITGSAVIIGLGLLVYFKKRRTTTEHTIEK